MDSEIIRDSEGKLIEVSFKIPDWMRQEYDLKKLRKKSNINQKKYRRSN